MNPQEMRLPHPILQSYQMRSSIFQPRIEPSQPSPRRRRDLSYTKIQVLSPVTRCLLSSTQPGGHVQISDDEQCGDARLWIRNPQASCQCCQRCLSWIRGQRGRCQSSSLDRASPHGPSDVEERNYRRSYVSNFTPVVICSTSRSSFIFELWVFRNSRFK